MKYLPLLILLASCSTISEKTGTEFSDRCHAYRLGLELTKELAPSPDRDSRIEIYKEFLSKYC